MIPLHSRPPAAFSRRPMLKTLPSGFGYLAFAELAARAAAPAAGRRIIPRERSR